VAPRILIVDDEPLTRLMLADFLETKGYKVFTASDGEEALRKVKSERPLLMLLDVRMPKMDGMEVLAKAKAMDPYLKVIMITGVKDEDVAQNAREMGADDYITKPLHLDSLEKGVWLKVLELMAKGA